MTDIEFDILDELYFVKTWEELVNIFIKADFDLETELWNLIEKKWVKVMDRADQEMVIDKMDYANKKSNLRFNASKQGLLAHNTV